MKTNPEMKRIPRIAALVVLILVAASASVAAPPEGTMAFTVSMDRPNTHYYHVAFRCEGLKGQTLDFKMPAWTPGYYMVMDYARNVLDFQAENGVGKPLPWEKTAKNTWRVTTGGATSVVVSYEVYAFARSVAESNLDDSQGFISPTGVFMHVAGRIRHPVTVTVQPFKDWTGIATGLDPVDGRPNTYSAPDFDILYDSPLLVGNLETLPFEVHGVPHAFTGVGLGSFDRAKLVSDLRRMVESAVSLFGEIPYRHYVFLSIGPGGGGLEHLNSVALTFNAASLSTPAGYKNFLSFISHEYFHNFNVKRIRPIALGPFDYDRENFTNLLWVSEGITVYYEDIVLNRAGLLGRDEVLERFRSSIARYENSPGHLFQSATQSSFDTWIRFFNRGGNAANTTISYYDKGAALGLLLDLKIRHETNNRKSLDDVMRALYQKFYKDKKRGFTDAEFREVCESTAGVPLAEIFVYASTVKDIDYPRYLALAGLEIDLQPKDLPGAYFGAAAQDQDGRLVATNIEWDSPASRAGLSVQDEILAVDGVRLSGARGLSEAFGRKKPGDTVKVLIARRGVVREVEVVLGKKTERNFEMKPIANPDPLQAAILKDWLKD
jgi:predicted metalloprotease with PDZ domain